MEEIVLNGKKYKLIPVEEEVENLVDEYTLSKTEPDREGTSGVEQNAQSEIKDAIPKVSEYRERYKQKKLRLSDIVAPPRILDIENKADGMLEQYNYKGDSLFFGEGLKIDY